MNKVIIIGRAGKDPEVRSLEGGVKVANFSIATTKHFTKNGEKQTVTTWHNIVCWSKLAELTESYVHKGDQVAIDGEIQIRDWTDKDGNKRQAFEIVANNIEFLSPKKSEDSSAEPPESNVYQRQGIYDKPIDKEEIHVEPQEESDLPF